MPPGVAKVPAPSAPVAIPVRSAPVALAPSAPVTATDGDTTLEARDAGLVTESVLSSESATTTTSMTTPSSGSSSRSNLMWQLLTLGSVVLLASSLSNEFLLLFL